MNEIVTSVGFVRVGIAEAAVVHLGNSVRTTGLGSCVGVVLFDTQAGVAGLVHVMLPHAPSSGVFIQEKYADSGICSLIELMVVQGASRCSLQAKIAGGAQMFSFPTPSEIMRVGPRNVEAVHDTLYQHRIQVLAEDTGGSVGRTIEFDLSTKMLSIRTAMKGSYTI